MEGTRGTLMALYTFLVRPRAGADPDFSAEQRQHRGDRPEAVSGGRSGQGSSTGVLALPGLPREQAQSSRSVRTALPGVRRGDRCGVRSRSGGSRWVPSRPARARSRFRGLRRAPTRRPQGAPRSPGRARRPFRRGGAGRGRWAGRARSRSGGRSERQRERPGAAADMPERRRLQQ